MQVAPKQDSSPAQTPAEDLAQAKAPAMPAHNPPYMPAAQELHPLHVSGVSADVVPAKISYAGSSRKLCVSDGIFGMFLCV